MTFVNKAIVIVRIYLSIKELYKQIIKQTIHTLSHTHINFYFNIPLAQISSPDCLVSFGLH